MDFIKKNKTWIGIGGCVIAIIGCFLPFAKASAFGMTVSETLLKGNAKMAWIIIIASAVAGALIYLKKEFKFVLIPLIISAIVNVYEMIDVTKDSMGLVKVSTGAYVIFIGIIVAAITLFIKED